MTINTQKNSRQLTEHFFRNEYGKMVSVITKYIGTGNVQTAEDIVQETLLKAVDYWQHHGIPEKPQAWLYTTAKNLTLNILKRKKYQSEFNDQKSEQHSEQLENLEISEALISDGQLKMMFVCCHPKISDNSKICLILKILCGFNISEIANSFFTSTETINKRLVRGRKQLRTNNISFELPKDININLPIVLKTIFLLFNEGYSPTQKNELIRYDLCLEAIRLTKILVKNEAITQKADCYALLALMYFNVSRFDSRMNAANSIIEMDKQNRKNWNQEVINKGIQLLNKATSEKQISSYLILASISANHCIASSFEKTDWEEILCLYDSLLELEDTPIIRLNRSVALSKVKGNRKAILELEKLKKQTKIDKNHLFHSTLGELYKLENDTEKARNSYLKAISLTKNERDIKLLQKKLMQLVPVS
ncbi:RNA polymerase sigma factor [Aquimarina agarilytica]|uniref:RNA polymerase sigma factor n=1 Tax=Aquimarina agarilytica TaxID=1087449 RepID=UPI0002887465|nr:sigma-70 family RNA polymerase sigma factor [Aquimarina agarilytica]